MKKKPKKKCNFKVMPQTGKKQPTKKEAPKKNGRLKINMPFEEAIKTAFDPKSTPNKK